MSNNNKLKQALNLRKQWNAEIAAGNVTNPNISSHAALNALAAASGGRTSAQLAQMIDPAPARRVAKPRGACKGVRCTVQGGKRRRRRSTKRRRVKH